MRTAIVCALVAALSGCTLTEARGPVISTVPQPVSCGQPVIRGELADVGGRVRVTLLGESTCGDSTVVTYRKDRWLKFNLLSGGLLALGTSGAFGAVTLGIASAAVRDSGSDASWHRPVFEILAWAMIGVGFAAGSLTALLVRRDLPPHKEVIETPGPREVRPLEVQGPLVSSSGEQRWPLIDGQVELEPLDASELESASVNGIIVTWSSTANARLESLGFCRRALSGWNPGALDCARVEPALRCAEGGWTLAAGVLEEAKRTCPERP